MAKRHQVIIVGVLQGPLHFGSAHRVAGAAGVVEALVDRVERGLLAG